MQHWYSRPVFFVKDTENSISFYKERLGFTPDWSHREGGRAFVCQLSRHGFELILAQDEPRAGKGRVFISLDGEQEAALRQEIRENRIKARDSWWGMPVIEVCDPDGNELLFSPP